MRVLSITSTGSVAKRRAVVVTTKNPQQEYQNTASLECLPWLADIVKLPDPAGWQLPTWKITSSRRLFSSSRPFADKRRFGTGGGGRGTGKGYRPFDWKLILSGKQLPSEYINANVSIGVIWTR